MVDFFSLQVGALLDDVKRLRSDVDSRSAGFLAQVPMLSIALKFGSSSLCENGL
jgi:hypothetical protein